ncbi:Acetyltransferase (GNAT) family protein [uncultured archaeon]|nr:Acetyltransferase (GNAT) family protein [uncultured archaeon]
MTAEVDILIREATVADLTTIMRHRRGTFYDMGFCDKAALDAMEATSAPFIKNGLEEGSFRAWMAEINGAVVAGGAVLIFGHPSAPNYLNLRRALILNMYTEPEHRHRGFATAIVRTIIEWCRTQGFPSVSLHASDAGRHLYEAFGFIPTNEMCLLLKQSGA